MKLRSVGLEFSIRHSDRQSGVTKLTVAVCNFAKLLTKTPEVMCVSFVFAVSSATVAATLSHKHSSSPGIFSVFFSQSPSHIFF
jgi:hypothetical protein